MNNQNMDLETKTTDFSASKGENPGKSVMPQILRAMEHDISDATGIDPVTAYKTIEEGIVGAYKAVEKGAVDAYHKVEDAMVDKLFRKEGETVEEAKERLRNQ